MDDLMFLLIYDEVPVDLLEDDRRRETDIHQRIERRWLGSITIPFSTLYTNGRVIIKLIYPLSFLFTSDN